VACRTGGAWCGLFFRRASRRVVHRSVSSDPLIEPDVTISVIRLSDEFHGKAFASRFRGRLSVDTTPSSPKIRFRGNSAIP